MADPTQSLVIPHLLLRRTDATVEFIPLMASDEWQRGRATATSS
jgi:hypothetical protein